MNRQETAERFIQKMLVYDQRSCYLLNWSLLLNLLYAVFHLFIGISLGSWWNTALCAYYAILAIMRFHLLRSMRRQNERAARNAYRHTAYGLAFLTVVMAGIFVQIAKGTASFHYPGYTIYAMAVYAFARIIVAVMNLVRRRRNENKELAAARCVSFAGALMSIHALQTGMFNAFDEAGSLFSRQMDIGVGAVIALLLMGLSLGMLRKARQEKHL